MEPPPSIRFRPISLCNISYKILAKIIANRLSPLLSELILPNQGGFVTGRQIWDNYILVQEAIHSSNTRGESGMAVKLDMANAFDRVEHNFLFKVMRKFGFSQNFMNWINSCIESPWIAPLINGRPGPFFKTSRGLRQGFPLSPILYVLMAESLNRSLEWESASGNIPGLKIAQGVKRLNHSQFADDTIILSDASKILARRILRVLDTFLTVSGGSLNKEKSQIYTWNVSAGTRAGITQIMGFAITQDWKSFKYLGLPLCLKTLPGEFWHILLQKFRGKMESWGARWLNPAGRVVLIKSVLSALPMFQFSTLLAPKGILQAMSQLIRKFLWQGGASNHKKLHLVKWEMVTQPKSRGGLGIRDPKITNLAMGAKLLWRLITGDNDWWKQALSSKYRLGKRIRSMDKPHLNQTGSQIWKLIKGASPFFREHLSWIPGNGKSIKIWQDRIFGVTFNPNDENLSDLKGWMLG
jgi:hypothetical protein